MLAHEDVRNTGAAHAVYVSGYFSGQNATHRGMREARIMHAFEIFSRLLSRGNAGFVPKIRLREKKADR